MKDIISAKGEVTLLVWNKEGKLIDRHVGNNLVVNVGKQALALLLSDADVNKRVNKIGFGTSGAATSGTDTDLQDSFVKAVDGIGLSGTSVTFEYALELSEYNGNTIREFGLFCDDDTLFSRITRNPIAKTADIRLTGTWKITF